MPIHPTPYTEDDYNRDKEDLIREERMKGTQDLAREIAASIAGMLQDPNINQDQDWNQLCSDLRDIEEAIIDMEEK